MAHVSEIDPAIISNDWEALMLTDLNPNTGDGKLDGTVIATPTPGKFLTPLSPENGFYGYDVINNSNHDFYVFFVYAESAGVATHWVPVMAPKGKHIFENRHELSLSPVFPIRIELRNISNYNNAHTQSASAGQILIKMLS